MTVSEYVRSDLSRSGTSGMVPASELWTKGAATRSYTQILLRGLKTGIMLEGRYATRERMETMETTGEVLDVVLVKCTEEPTNRELSNRRVGGTNCRSVRRVRRLLPEH